MNVSRIARKSLDSLLVNVLPVFACLWLGGCGAGTVVSGSGAVAVDSPVSGVSLSGVAHGGQNPISGGSIQLYVAGEPAMPASGTGTGGFGQGATALLPVGSMTMGSANNYWPYGSTHTGATCMYTTGNPNQCTGLPATSASGAFSISSDYMCPSSSGGVAPQVYLIVAGGNPGLTGSVNNKYIALMAALGPCSGLSSSTFISVNEVTTVGAVWALQQFLSAPSGIPASSYASQGGSTPGVGVNAGAPSGPAGGYGSDQVQIQEIGLVNAFAMASDLVNVANGQAGGTNKWATVDTAKLNAIANTLAACVNSDGVSSPNACASLMTDATVGAEVPADTVQAAYMMARNPSNKVPTLLGLAAASPPFQPALAATTANLDLTLAVGLAPTYGAASGFSGGYAAFDTQQIAIDEHGNAWLLNTSGTGNGGTLTKPFVSELAPNGAVLGGPFQSYAVSGGFTSVASPCPDQTHTLQTNATRQMAIDQNQILWVPNAGEAGTPCNNEPNSRTLMRVDTDAATVETGYWEYGSEGALVVDDSNNVWWNGSGSYIQAFVNGSSTWTGESTVVSSPSSGAAADQVGNVWLDDGTTCTVGSTANVAGILYQLASSSASAPVIVNGFYNNGDTSCTAGTHTTSESVQGTVTGLAADANSGLWAVSQNNSQIAFLAPQSADWATAVSGGTPIPTTGATYELSSYWNSSLYLSNPTAVAVDGSNTAWVVGGSQGASGSSLAQYSVGMVSGTGNIAASGIALDNEFVFPSTSTPYGTSEHAVAIDPSGNLWIANASSSANWVTVVVGAATPVITPLSFQAKYKLIGATTAPTVVSSPSSLTYASTMPGASVAAQTVTISNAGTGPLTVSSVTLTGANAGSFAITSNTCPSYLPGGGTCTVSVSFTPLTVGSITASLSIANSGVLSPLAIPLAGASVPSAAPAAPVISPASGTYTSVQVVMMTESTPTATIFYTTDGSVPSYTLAGGNPVASGTTAVYSSPFATVASGLETVNAVAVVPANGDYLQIAASSSASYNINTSGAATTATVTVNPANPGIGINELLLGMVEYAWGYPKTMAPYLLPAYKAAGIKGIRWPGGSESDVYHWENATVCGSTWGTVQPFGAPYGDFFDAITVPGSIDVWLTANYGTNATCNGPGEVSEAVGWVQAALAHGATVGAVTVGNEEYGGWELDYHSGAGHDPLVYSSEMTGPAGFYSAIKAVSPKTQVGIDVKPGNSWDSTVLQNAKGSYDFVEQHFYAQGSGSEDDTFLVQQAAQTLTAAINVLKGELTSAGVPNTPIYVGEIGSVYNNPGKQSWSITQGLFTGQVLGEMMNEGVARATWFTGFGLCEGNDPTGTKNGYFPSLYGFQTFGSYNIFGDPAPDSNCPGEPTNGTMSPSARAYELFSNVIVQGEKVLTPTLTGPSTNVRAYAATHSGGTVFALFNVDKNNYLPVVVSLQGHSSSSDVTVITYSKAIYDLSQNNVWAPPTTVDLGAQSLPLTLALDPWSMNIVIVK